MTTNIQNNQPIQLTSSAEPLQSQSIATKAPASSEAWLPTNTERAAMNNRLALQNLQAEGPNTSEARDRLDVHYFKPYSHHQYQPNSVLTSIEEADDGIQVNTYLKNYNAEPWALEKQELLSSNFDKDGNLKESTLLIDKTGDEQFNYIETQFFDENGGISRQEISEDLEGDGNIDTVTIGVDSDGNGKLDTYTKYIRDEQGKVLSRIGATDENEDGILDFGRIDSFDQAGNLSASEEVVFEGGTHTDSDELPITEQPLTNSELSIRISVSNAGETVSQTIGSATIAVSNNTEGGMSVTTSIDMTGDGQLEGYYVSNFDENGTLRSNEKNTDYNSDGVLDNITTNTYNEDGETISHSSLLDRDGNGLFNHGRHLTKNPDGTTMFVEQFFDNDTGILAAQKTDKYGYDGIRHQQTISIDNNLNGIFERELTDIYDDGVHTSIKALDGRGDNEDGIADYVATEITTAEGSTRREDMDLNSDGIIDVIRESIVDSDDHLISSQIIYTEDGIFAGEPPVNDTPPTIDAEPLLPGLVPGPIIDDLVTPKTPNATASAQFISEDAGYSNALYTYDLDDQGNVSNIRQVINNSNEMDAGAALGDIALFNDQPNLLLLPNGANLVRENPQLTFADGKLHIDGQEHTGDVYFSHSTEISTDGKQHFQISTDEQGHSSVKIEDLHNLGDQDFNDLEIKVLNDSDSLTLTGLTPTPTPERLSNYRVPDLLL